MTNQETGGVHGEGKEVLHAGMRGAVAAMSMSGIRILFTRVGLLANTPPEMVAEEELPAVLRRLSEPAREALVLFMHWGYGASGGAVFGALPAGLRLRRWSGPIYGFVLWFGFESAIAPVLGLRKLSLAERALLAGDHLLYGAVLSELRTRPRR